MSDPWEQLSDSCPADQAPGRTTTGHPGNLHRGRCWEQGLGPQRPQEPRWGRGDVPPTGRLETGLVTGSQWTELQGLPGHRTAGQPVHPVANSLTLPQELGLHRERG